MSEPAEIWRSQVGDIGEQMVLVSHDYSLSFMEMTEQYITLFNEAQRLVEFHMAQPPTSSRAV